MLARRSLLILALATAITLTGTILGTRPDGARAFNIASISAAGFHTCALMTPGELKCWGGTVNGLMGDGAVTSSTAPLTLVGLESGVATVDAGAKHTCVVTEESGAKCWGTNIFGQLGDGTTTNRASPVNVSGLGSGVAAVAGGHNHTCALTTAGGVKCWGDNSYGQLGDGTTTDRTTPVNVFGLGSGVTAIAAGGFHTCALKAGGSLVCWGRNVYGQVGDGASGEPNLRTTPVGVVGMGSGVAAVATGTFHTCARMTGGAVKCWGWNFYGQIGDGTNLSRANPTTVAVSGVTLLETGSTHSCVIITGGSVTCWGDNEFGQAGDGTTESINAPVNVIGLPGAVTTITGGSDHTCAITEAGGLLCWGRNDGGQLGDGTGITSPAPVSVLGLNPKPTRTPTATPTSTPTPTVTPTPKDGAADTDGDTVPNSTDLDDDNDGCTDSAEVGSTVALGGRRNPHDVWDFFDTPDPNALPERDKAITIADIFRVAGRFGATDLDGTAPVNRNTSLFSTPGKSGYHPAFDRGGQAGANVWNQAPADGAITITDIFAVAGQFGHDCS